MNRLLLTMLLLPIAPAFAGSCEDSFQKKGNPLTGTSYTASVSVPDLSVESAMGQMRGIALGRGMDILSEDVEGGSMLVEQPETMAHKPLPMIITAANEAGTGRVTALLRLNKGAFGGADGIRAEMCAMLGQIKPGKEGAQFAAKGSSAVAKPTETSAFMLSEQITRQAADNLSAIDARYQGKVFKVTGRTTITMPASGGRYTVGLGSSDPSSMLSVAITCEMAKDQTANTLSIRKGDKLTLMGTFDNFEVGRRIF